HPGRRSLARGLAQRSGSAALRCRSIPPLDAGQLCGSFEHVRGVVSAVSARVAAGTPAEQREHNDVRCRTGTHRANRRVASASRVRTTWGVMAVGSRMRICRVTGAIHELWRKDPGPKLVDNLSRLLAAFLSTRPCNPSSRSPSHYGEAGCTPW